MAFKKVSKYQSKGKKQIRNNRVREGPKQGAQQECDKSFRIWRKEIDYNDRKVLKDDKESTLHQLFS